MWENFKQRFGGAPKCAVCGKATFPQEQILFNKFTYHEACFKCIQCKSSLTTSTANKVQDQVYCQNCFQRLPPSQRTAGPTKEKEDDKMEQKQPQSPASPTSSSYPLSPPRVLTGKTGRGSPPTTPPPSAVASRPSSIGLTAFQDNEQKDLFSCGVCGTEYRFKLTFAPANLTSFLTSPPPISSSTSPPAFPSTTAISSSPQSSTSFTKILAPNPPPLTPNQAKFARLLANFVETLPSTGVECPEYEGLRIFLEELGAPLPSSKASSRPTILTSGDDIDEKGRVEKDGDEDEFHALPSTRLSSFKEEEEKVKDEKDEKSESVSALPAMRSTSDGSDFRRDPRTGLRSTVPRGEVSTTSLGGSSDSLGSLGGFSRSRGRARSSSTGAPVARKRTPSIVEYAMGKSGEKGDDDDDSARTARLETVEKFLEAIQLMSAELEPHKAADKIIEETSKLLMCERSNLFTVDPDTDELVLTIHKGDTGSKEVRLPMSKGMIGNVATKGELLNIKDTSSDPRFDDLFDKASGEVTRNMLAVPISLSDTGEIIAVIQCINKMLVPNFSAQDEILLQNIAAHSSIVLRNSQLYLQALRAEQKVNSLLELVQMLHSSPNITSLIFTLSARAHQLVNADKCTLYLCDRTRTPAQLVVMQGEIDVRFPINKGLAGHVATTGEIVNIPDCYKDDRFNKQVDIKTGYHTKSMLCMPIFGDESEKEVIGVLQFLNKMDEPEFGPADESILAVLLKIAGPIIKNSFFFKREKHESPGAPATLSIDEHPASARYRVGGGLEAPLGPGKSPLRTPRQKEKFAASLGSFAEGE